MGCLEMLDRRVAAHLHLRGAELKQQLGSLGSGRGLGQGAAKVGNAEPVKLGETLRVRIY